MTQETTERNITILAEGPFILQLRTGGNGQREIIGRLIVGGGQGSHYAAEQAQELINELPRWAPYPILFEEARRIANSLGLVRVDF